MTKIAGSGSGSGSESGSIGQRHRSADPDTDPHQNVMDPEHCFLRCATGRNLFVLGLHGYMHFMTMIRPLLASGIIVWCARLAPQPEGRSYFLRFPNQIPLPGRSSSVFSPEPEFANILKSPGIDSQPGGPVRQSYLTYRPALVHGLVGTDSWVS